MSRLPDSLRTGRGANNYGNGYSDSSYSVPRRVDEDELPPDSGPVRPPPRSRDRRAGQYGGLQNPYSGFAPTTREDTLEDDGPQVERPTSLERTVAKRRSGNVPYAQRSPSRQARQNGNGSRQIEDVLRSIKQDWSFMTDENCIPVQISLQFMDSSSLGLAGRYPRFKELYMQLQSALRAIVNEHHQGFNSSIGTFHSIQSALQSSQQRLRTLKESLAFANTSLSTTKPELVGLATGSQNYDDMLIVLTAIEHLRGIPEKLEALISEKRFLSAVELLQDALKSIRKSNMDDIGALSDLKVYLSNQEHSLTDILIEELHNHLYLKSPYSENRWMQHASQHVKGIPRDTQPATMGSRQLYQFLDQLDTDTIIRDDPIKNPEADTFTYIHLLVESLNTLGRLDTVVETINQRLPVELFNIVEKSSREVDQRYPVALRGSKGTRDVLEFSNPARSAVLNDLFGTLYARFETIAEGHRIVHEVISGITKREGTRGSSSLTSGFRELWKLYQSEIRSLFHDYLANDGDLSYRSRDDNARGGSVFQRNQRDKLKKMFKLTDMDNKSADLISEREDLESILKNSVPGLVSDSKRTESLDPSNSTPANDGSATGHKLLVEPSVFNMGILLPPSLTFLNRLKEVVPPSSDIVMSTLTSFLDDFLINVFLPQLDETLVEMCSQAFIEADAFQQDPQWAMHAKKPIFKGTVKFFSLIEAFCKMLDNLPHDQAFSQLIITQIMTYYDKCYGWYKALIARTHPHPQTGKRTKLAATLTEDNDLTTIIDQLLITDDKGRRGLIDKEITSIVAAIENVSIEEADLMLDRRSIAGMCLLHTSMKWLAKKMMQMRFISAQANETLKRESEHYDRQRRWTLIAAQKPANTNHVYIPLNEETAAAFDGVHNSYLQLSNLVLRMLHVEIRGHIMLYINRSMSRTFQLDQLLNEPDPEVVSLNADLVGFDEELATHLQSVQHAFITTGLASLVDTLLVTGAPHIPIMNAAGCGRLQLNILVLQQNLKNVEANALLLRSTLYFDMFSTGPDSIIAQAKENGKDLGFSFNEMKTLLDLWYSEAMASERREVAVAAKRGLEDHVLQLSEFLW